MHVHETVSIRVTHEAMTAKELQGFLGGSIFTAVPAGSRNLPIRLPRFDYVVVEREALNAGIEELVSEVLGVIAPLAEKLAQLRAKGAGILFTIVREYYTGAHDCRHSQPFAQMDRQGFGILPEQLHLIGNTCSELVIDDYPYDYDDE